ncbi:MAG: sigma-54 dependent transcriptional regulator [Pirellulales bacterium]
MSQNQLKELAALIRPMVGVSNWVRDIQADIRAVAPFSSSVLIVGPSGTGKELIARSVHAKSTRFHSPFIPVNCAAISGTLFESHMFGHLKGAFTGSDYAALGCFRAADGGTIFLDEIGELAPAMQAKLLRVLQEGTVVPVGGHEEQTVDVRVVAATNRNLMDDVARGLFREDLYYRLAVVTLQTLPLCERSEDIELLAEYLISRQSVEYGMPFKPLTQNALEKLRQHTWPGNVRELQNVLERAAMLARGALLDSLDIVFDGVGPKNQSVAVPKQENHSCNDDWKFPDEVDGHWPSLDECERQFIAATLQHTGYNQAATARLLNMDRSVLRRRIKKLGIDISQSTPGRPTNVRNVG